MKRYFFVFLFFISKITFAQNIILQGKVLDSQSQQPLAFVSIGIEGTRQGTVSDIDGKFTIIVQPQSVLLVSYVGFESKRLTVSNLYKKLIIIELIQKNNDITEVVVRPSLNPAHRIIRLAVANKPLNDPEQIEAFSYNSYTIAGLATTVTNIKPSDPDKLKKYKAERAKEALKEKPLTPTQLQNDSIMRRVVRELFRNYLLVNETHTLRQFLRPNLSKETILATKLSGLTKSPLAMVPSNFQPFGFYKSFFTMVDGRTYESPLTNGAIRQYDFELLDTLIHDTDSTFIISFAPQNGKNFEALKGLLYINSDGYAVENVIAEPAQTTDRKLIFKLQQKYERVGGRWFPNQLNTEVAITVINNNSYLDKIDSTVSKWTTRSYVFNVDFNKKLTKSSFSDISQEMDTTARNKPDSYWETIRPDSLDNKAQKTYEAYSKLPETIKKQMNRSVNSFTEIIQSGALPLGKYLETPLDYFLAGANEYEKFRLGAGLRTSAQFSKKIVLEGAAGYGFGDKAFKYSGAFRLNINQLQTNYLKLSYRQDIEEPANVTSVFGEYMPNLMAASTLRQFMTTRFDSLSRWSVELGLRPLRKTQLKLWAMTENRNPARYDYQFLSENTQIQTRNVTNTEIGLTLRLSSDEKLNRSGHQIYATALPKRLLLIQASQAISALGGQLGYSKLHFQYIQSVVVRGLGRTELRLEAAKVWGDASYFYLFNGNGSSNGSMQILIPQTFQTMGLYEFLSDRYVNLFLSHDFGRLLYRNTFKYSQPEFSLHHSVGFGSLQSADIHNKIDFKTLQKGYFESGILINNLLRIEYQRTMYFGLGLGVFRRYGHYSLPENNKNWNFRLGLTASF